MKNNYINSLILGIMCLTINVSLSQNILVDGDFSVTTEIVPFDTPTPPINTWAFWVNYWGNGSGANPTVVDGVCAFQITNPGYDTWDIQLAQWGFPLNQGHLYQLLFDVKADDYRSFGVFLGEDGGNYTNLIGQDKYYNDATPDWQTISIDFEATSVFTLHKLSFELGANGMTMYFDNVILQDMGPAPPKKIVIAGTFQDEQGCNNDWDPNCDYTELTLNPSTGLYTGTFQVPEGKNRYKVTVGGSWAINYGENGLIYGPDIFLCVPSGSEEITFTYDPSTHLVTTSPIASGISADCLPQVVLAGSFQDELGCYSDWVPDCTNTALIYNLGSGLFEADLNIPTGCYEYRVVLENSWENTFGQEGIHNGPNYIIFIPVNPDATHFTYDPVSHILISTPYNDPLNEVTKVSLIGTIQDELGCANDYDYECDNPALQFNSDSNVWEGSFTLPAGCYTYQVKETVGCNNIAFYGENGIEWGNEIQLYVPSDGEITFSYDAQTHIVISTPYTVVPPDVTKVSLIGTIQDELGCANDYDYECDNPALQFNSDSNVWEGSFTLPAGCYTYQVKETVGCNNIAFYGENGIEWGNEIQLYVPSNGEITFSYDPQTHIISSTPDTDLSTLNQCPNNISVNNAPGSCGAIVNYPEFVATANCGGDMLSITQTEGLPSGSYFPVGITTNSFKLTKITGEEITCSFNVVVLDTEPPVISNLNRTYKPLWPVNHKMVPVFIEYFTSDNCNIATTALYISSNEPVNGLGDGNKAPDWEILDAHNVLLRAERSGNVNGREYYITIKVMDDSGNLTQEVVTITVPHDNGTITEGNNKTKLGKNEFILYPNGVDNVVNIKGPKSTSNQSYVIYDLLGVMKKKGTITNDQIDVETLPSGIYILKFEKDNEYIFKKFIKN
jgi:hypothetical protein